jgi:hypothetical protein
VAEGREGENSRIARRFSNLVDQRERRVEVYRRDVRRWHLDEYGSGERLTLDSLAITLVVDEIYVDRIGPIVG